ncbi:MULTISPECIES: arginase [Cohnella]|uniref:arginase n=1 Tax=Cohnella TaxID=329857 RepID=UPI0009BC5E4A|nr:MULTISPECIES: arginase [Cohnella]MBN2982896.1 arginase [Cohnella algarum]
MAIEKTAASDPSAWAGTDAREKKVRLIRVPFWLGGGRSGVEFGPESIMKAGLLAQLKTIGIRLVGDSEVECPRHPLQEAGEGKVKYLPEVREMSRQVSEHVSKAVSANFFPLILGGDHSISIGSLAGLTQHRRNLGVIWFDAHCDINTEETTPSGNMHGMPLAVALGKSRFKLSDIPNASLIGKEKLVIVGARDIDEGEKELIRSEGIACFTMHDIDRFGMRAVVEKAIAIACEGTDGVHVSFDMDCLDPLEAPGVGTPVPGGINYREAHFAMEMLAETGRVTSMDLVEVNAVLDYNRRTSRLGVELIASLLGKRIL